MCGPRSIDDAGAVNVALLFDDLGGLVDDVVVADDAGVIIEHIQPPTGMRSEVCQCVFPLVVVGDIEFAGDDVGIIAGQFFEGKRVDIVHTDNPAFLVESKCDLTADARRSTRDKNTFTL